MRKLKINNSQILIGEGYNKFDEYTDNKQVIVVLDKNTDKFYGNVFSDYKKIIIDTGEGIKTVETIFFILQKLVNYKADRTTFLLGVGGGIVCDIVGFSSSIFMRGIEFGFVSTTLLSQVDASIGGKNGVNFQGYKNIVGVVNQPKFVICDSTMLKTLEKSELNCGFAEIVKYAILSDNNMFEFLEKNVQEALNLDNEIIDEIIYQSAKIKCEIVSRDEKEAGERRKLNLGHTYGHAVEKLKKISHGNAVSIGLVMAAELSEKKGMLQKCDLDRIINLLKRFNLPTITKLSKAELFDTIIMDKKREQGFINFVFIKGIGKVEVKKIDINDLK